jgi:exopolyphosphatase/guanosine-5'-triphosphate,3'-diphosphate pyrophosphatase
VARLACNLFDELSHLYEADVHDRLYLEAAALLANVGLVVSHARHHIHSYYIIRNADLLGFTDREIEIIAQVARYHRKSEPKLQHQQFAQLNAEDQETVRFLSGILRIAIGLDRTHDGRTTSVEITRKQDDLQIVVLGKRNTDHELNIYAAHERRHLLQDALHCTIALATKR